MIKTSVSVNGLKEAIAHIDSLIDGVKGKATLRAVNRAVDVIATEANREIRKIYLVPAREVSKSMRKKKAFLASREASGSVFFSGRGLNLAQFRARQTKKGVSVQVKVQGGRHVIPGSFLAASTRNNATGGGSMGIKMVYVRVGRERYPIKSLRSVSVPQTVQNEAIEAAVKKAAQAAFIKTFDQQMAYLKGSR